MGQTAWHKSPMKPSSHVHWLNPVQTPLPHGGWQTGRNDESRFKFDFTTTTIVIVIIIVIIIIITTTTHGPNSSQHGPL
jgi:hypothetical protein